MTHPVNTITHDYAKRYEYVDGHTNVYIDVENSNTLPIKLVFNVEYCPVQESDTYRLTHVMVFNTLPEMVAFRRCLNVLSREDGIDDDLFPRCHNFVDNRGRYYTLILSRNGLKIMYDRDGLKSITFPVATKSEDIYSLYKDLVNLTNTLITNIRCKDFTKTSPINELKQNVDILKNMKVEDLAAEDSAPGDMATPKVEQELQTIIIPPCYIKSKTVCCQPTFDDNGIAGNAFYIAHVHADYILVCYVNGRMEDIDYQNLDIKKWLNHIVLENKRSSIIGDIIPKFRDALGTKDKVNVLIKTGDDAEEILFRIDPFLISLLLRV